MRIHSLLNPFDTDDSLEYRSSESPAPRSTTRPETSNTLKRQKLPKDAAIFTDAKVNGPVNYPPHETDGDEELLAHHIRFKIYPLGNIQERGARRIPYNSDKKDFMPKTGRDAFEVFQYEFKVPGDEKQYSVLWDYQIGLVRITPFFKCCKYNKTTPAKVLNLNTGLRDISYSITGGALAAQGYWMPYEAAKAVAATFCYNIRYALTPLFGKDFLHQCLHPKHPEYAQFHIDAAIVEQCERETKSWRTEGLPWKDTKGRTQLRADASGSSTPSTPNMKPVCPPWAVKSARSQTSRYAYQESGYGTDENPSEKGTSSPQVSPPSTTWTSINQSPALLPAFNSPDIRMTSNPRVHDDSHSYRSHRAFRQVACRRVIEDSPLLDVVMDDTSGEQTYHGGDYLPKTQLPITDEDLEAAEILLSLSAADDRLCQSK